MPSTRTALDTTNSSNNALESGRHAVSSSLVVRDLHMPAAQSTTANSSLSGTVRAASNMGLRQSKTAGSFADVPVKLQDAMKDDSRISDDRCSPDLSLPSVSIESRSSPSPDFHLSLGSEQFCGDDNSKGEEAPVRKKQRHPRARGGKKIQARKTAQAARLAAQAQDMAGPTRETAKIVSVGTTNDGIVPAGEVPVAAVDAEGSLVAGPLRSSSDALAATSRLPLPTPRAYHVPPEEGHLVLPLVLEDRPPLPLEEAVPQTVRHDDTTSSSIVLRAGLLATASVENYSSQKHVGGQLELVCDDLRGAAHMPVFRQRKRKRPLKAAVKAAVTAAVVKQSRSLRLSRVLDYKACAAAVKSEQNSPCARPKTSGSLILPTPGLVDAQLASNAHYDSPVAEVSLVPRREAHSPGNLQLSDGHFALLRTLFPHGDPGLRGGPAVCEPPSKDGDGDSVVSNTLIVSVDDGACSDTLFTPVEDDPDTLASDLVATQQELSSLKDTLSALLARMERVRDARPSEWRGGRRATTRAAGSVSERNEARAQRVLGLLLEDLERISMLAVRLTAAVQLESVGSSL